MNDHDARVLELLTEIRDDQRRAIEQDRERWEEVKATNRRAADLSEEMAERQRSLAERDGLMRRVTLAGLALMLGLLFWVVLGG